MTNRLLRVGVWTAALLVATPSVALANAGLPMLAIVWPGMWIALIPVIALETHLLIRVLEMPPRRMLVVVSTANGVSTMLGVPLTWAGLFAVQALVPGGGGAGPDMSTIFGRLFAVTVQAPWLMPYAEHLQWMIPVATVVLLVPFFFASWGIEYLTAVVMMRDVERPVLRSATFWANVVSYVLLAVMMPVILAVMMQRGGI